MKQHMRMQDKIILRLGAKFLVPFILLFAFYVQFHGDFGPGGGFQAGVIAAAAFVLYGLIFGLDTAQKVIPKSWLEKGMAIGVLVYGGTGVATTALGLSLIVRIQEAYGTAEEDEIVRLDLEEIG